MYHLINEREEREQPNTLVQDVLSATPPQYPPLVVSLPSGFEPQYPALARLKRTRSNSSPPAYGTFSQPTPPALPLPTSPSFAALPTNEVVQVGDVEAPPMPMKFGDQPPHWIIPYNYYWNGSLVGICGRIFLLLFGILSVTVPFGTYPLFHWFSLPPCFFDFPPHNCTVKPDFSALITLLLALSNVVTLAMYLRPNWFGWCIDETPDPVIVASMRLFYPPDIPVANPTTGVFQWYGWVALFVMIPSWALSFTEWQDWMGSGNMNIKRYVFPGLWYGFIFFLDALVFMLKGESLMTSMGKRFYLFFGTSALSWWMYEYLGLFQQAWWYPNADVFPRWFAVPFAVICYATIQPAIFEWYDLLSSISWFQRAYGKGPKLPVDKIPPILFWLLSIGLYFVYAINPLNLFGAATALLAPMLGFAASVSVLGLTTPWSLIAKGNYAPLMTMMIACLANGFFWEMWNEGTLNSATLENNSSALWRYDLMYVDRYFIFEVPAFAFVSYLPFGITNLTQYLYFCVLFNLTEGKMGPFLMILINVGVIVGAVLLGVFA